MKTKEEKSIGEGLFTQDQKDYVASVTDNQLRAHLLHQVRLRDNMEQDRNSFEAQSTGNAKQQAIAFAEWKIANRWFTYENGYWHYTFEQGTAVSEASYNKNYRKTTEQLYALFIEQQSKQP